MRPQYSLPLTLLFPFLPWIFLAPIWASKNWSSSGLYWLAASGLVLDLWWGKPFGMTALLLTILAAVVKLVSEHWPTNIKVLWVMVTVVSFLIFEAYLHFL